MSLLLDGQGRRELRDILLAAFTRSKLDRALSEASPAHDLTRLVAEGPFEDEVAELIDAAEREGWLGQFEGLLSEELPERKDLQERLARVLRDAAANAKDLGDDTAPAVALRGRLLTVGGIGIALGTAACILGILTYTRLPLAGLLPLGLALVGFAFAVASAALTVGALLKDRLGDRASALARSWLPAAWIGGLGVLVLANGLLLWRSGRGAPPNFILQVVDQSGQERKVVADQPVHLQELVALGEEERRVDRVTNVNGQAFFNLRLGSGILYSGGIAITDGDAWRDCVFPAFPALEERLVEQNVAALNCRVGRGTERAAPDADSALRISSEFASSPALASEVRARLPTDQRARARRAPLGVPDAPIIIDRLYYTVGFDPGQRVPLWTAFTVQSEGDRQPRGERPRFAPDPDLPLEYQSQSSDYRDNPYDRGHLVSSSDARSAGPDAEREVYYYTAVVPQAPETNRGTWARLEDFTREVVGRAGPIHVVSGPIYSRTGRLVIGPGETLVPIALYRVLLRRDSGGRWRALAFVVLNDGSVGRVEPESVVVPVREVEARTGLVFFPDLVGDESAGLKTTVDAAAFLD